MNINQIAELAAQTVREVLSAHPEPDPTEAVLGDDHIAHALAHTMLARDWQGVVGNHPMARAGALAAMGEGEAADLYLNPTDEDHLAHGLARFAMALAQRELFGDTE
jgi:hypothetical protein